MSSLLKYALDRQNNIVYIDDVAKGLACDCHCPSCNERLVAKNGGSKRVHHFAHASGIECENAYESILHKLAKVEVRDAFLNNDVFNIQFEYRSYCPMFKSCGFVRYGDCCTTSIKKFNLKDYYDSCEQEVQYDSINRRSDLKFFSSKDLRLPPIYIEFFVTHASDDYKLHKGGRIIEVQIESEADIERIVKYGLTESFMSRHMNYSVEEKNIRDVVFYGFKNEDYEALNLNQEILFSRYILYASGKSQCYQDASNCKKLSKMHGYSLMEICFHTDVAFGIYDMAKYLGYKRFGIKNCLYCKNYVDSYEGIGKLCRLYKRLGINKYGNHDTARAKECKYFILDEQEMTDSLRAFDCLSPSDYTEL